MTTATQTRSIQMLPATGYFDTPASAWGRLLQLHYRAVDDGRPRLYEDYIAAMSPAEAFTAYSDSCVALIAQIAMASPFVHATLLSSLCDIAATTESLDGIEGPLLNLTRAVQYTGDAAALARAADTFTTLGVPDILGGGAQTSLLFDAGTGLLSAVTADDITSSLDGIGRDGWGQVPTLTGSDLGLGRAGRASGFDLLFGGGLPGLGDDVEETGWEEGAKIGAIVGGAIGAGVGLFVGAAAGPAGALSAGAAGAAVGAATGAAEGAGIGLTVDAVKTVVGWLVDRPDAPAPQGGNAPAPTQGGNAPAPTQGGNAPAPTQGGNAPAPSGNGRQPKTLNPDDEGKSPVGEGFGGERGDDGAVEGQAWAKSQFPSGPGMSAFASGLTAQSLLLTGYPTVDDDGTVNLNGAFPIADLGRTDLGSATSPTGTGTRIQIGGRKGWRIGRV